MAKRSKAKRKNKRPDPVGRFLRPTEAREAHNDFQSAGAAVRVRPVIETLLGKGKLTRAQFDNLAYYREQAHKAEDDAKAAGPLDPEKIMGGSCGGSPGGKLPAIMLGTPAIIETARIERDVGQLLPILQAVVRDDMTLSKWCIQQHGGRERYDGKGKFIAMVPVCEKRVMAQALLELRYAAGAIVR